jgi:hypothetical protein
MATTTTRTPWQRTVMAVLANAAPGEAFFALPEEKTALAQLAQRKLVLVRKTDEKCSDFTVWYARAAK